MTNIEIFTADTYRLALEVSFKFYKKKNPALTKSRLAERMGVHSSLLTNVLKERADLTADQIYLFSQSLGMPELESEFLELLWSRDRTALEEKRLRISKKLDHLKSKHISVSSQSEMGAPDINQEALAFYWTTPLAQVVVLSLAIRKFSLEPSLLIDELGVRKEEFEKVFHNLQKYNIVLKQKSRWISSLGDYHLPKESPLCSPQNKMMRLASLNQTERLDESQYYQLAVTFSANLNTYFEMQKEIVTAIQKCQKAVETTGRHSQVFQLNVDLFPWTLK